MAGTGKGSSNAAGDDGRSTLERALGVLAEVRAGEGVTALLLTANVFLLLTAYYVIKPVREGLILAMASGAEYKSYMSAAIAVALLFAVPAYAQVANRAPKNKLVVGVTLFFASHLAIFYVLSKIPSIEKNLGLPFFVWVGIFNMMVVAQFWAFANDLYNEERGKRLFAVVGIGASVGAALGAYVTNALKDGLGLGVYELLLVSGAMLVGCALLTQFAHKRERGGAGGAQEVPAPISKQAKPAKPDAPGDGAFAMVFAHKYLWLIALFSLVFTWVNTNGEYMLSVLVKEEARSAAAAKGIVGDDAIRAFAKSFGTGFYGDFFLWVNIFGVLLQMFAVSRIVKFGGLRLGFFVLPVIALADSVGVALLPALLGIGALRILRPGKVLENAADYSLNNTVRQMLWLPTSTEMKYKAKQAVDTFFVRMGDVASAVLVFFGSDRAKWPDWALFQWIKDHLAGQTGYWPLRTFAFVNVGLVAVWLFLAAGIVRENAKQVAAREKGANEPVKAPPPDETDEGAETKPRPRPKNRKKKRKDK